MSSPIPHDSAASRTRTPRWIIAGFVVLAFSFVLPFLGLVVLVIGIVALANSHIRLGVILVVLSIVVPIGGSIVVQRWLVKPYRIPSEAMVPTLNIGDRLFVLRTAKGGVGDIVVFHPPAGAEDVQECGVARVPRQACRRPTPAKADVNFIKRIVAGPGDTVAIDAGHMIVNGKRVEEPYATSCDEPDNCDLPRSITIPPDHYFMMGDNRGTSDDSRFWGPVPRDWIEGRAFFRYYPFGEAGGL